jgi:hypothetical protein
MITEEIARKVLTIVDAGLTKGRGLPVPGEMCVEAAVCLALGLPHSDDPPCVSRSLRTLKIRLNDASWSSPQLRAQGLRRLALIQLGSRGIIDERAFVEKLGDLVIKKYVPLALRAAASVLNDPAHKVALIAAASKCELEGTRESVLQAYTATASAGAGVYAEAALYAVYAARAAFTARAEAVYALAAAGVYAEAALYAVYAARAGDAAYFDGGVAACDKAMAEFAEDVVQILIGMNAPGHQWLFLTEGETA